MDGREDEGEREAGMISHNGPISGQTLDDPLLLSLLTEPIVYHSTNSRVPGQNSLRNWQNKALCTKEAFWINLFKIFRAILSCVGATSSILSLMFFLTTLYNSLCIYTIRKKMSINIYKSALIKNKLRIQDCFKLTFSSILWRKSEEDIFIGLYMLYREFWQDPFLF